MFENLFQQIEEHHEHQEYTEASCLAYEALCQVRQALSANLMFDRPIKLNEYTHEVLDEMSIKMSQELSIVVKELEWWVNYSDNCAQEQEEEAADIAKYGSYNDQVKKQYLWGKL